MKMYKMYIKEASSMTKLIMEPTRDCTGTMMQSFRSPKGGNLTFADLHNYLVRTFGGGVYLAVINANDGELVDKISAVDAYDAGDMERFL